MSYDYLFLLIIIVALSSDAIVEILKTDEGDNVILYFKHNDKTIKEFSISGYECYFTSWDTLNYKQLVYSRAQHEDAYLLHLQNRSAKILRPNEFGLIITKVNLNDSGYYRCGSVVDSWIIQLVIESQPILMVNGNMMVNHSLYDINKQVNILCEMFGDNRTKLYIENNKVELFGNSLYIREKIGTKIIKYVTTVFNVSQNDLECRSQTGKLHVKVSINVRETSTVIVQHEDQVILDEDQVILDEGQDVILLFRGFNINRLGTEFDCYVKRGENKEHKLVYGRNDRFSLSNRYNGTFEHPDQFKLIIYRVQVNDSGKYSCGPVKFAPTIQLLIESHPILMVNGNRMLNHSLYAATKLVNISCEMYGDNTTKLYIEKNKVELIGNSSYTREEFGFKITKYVTTVFNISENDLECRSQTGKLHIKVTINVKDRASCNESVKKYSLYTWQPFTLECPIHSSPSIPVFYWYKNEELIPSEQTKVIHIKAENSKYFCEAINGQYLKRCEIQIHTLEYPLPSASNTGLIVSMAIIFGLILLIIIVVFRMKSWRRKIPGRSIKLDVMKKDKGTEFNQVPAAPFYSEIDGSSETYEHLYETIEDVNDDALEKDVNKIPNLNIYDMDYIGAGNFAIVYKGTCKINYKIARIQRVAVKMPKDFVNWKNHKGIRDSFLLEIDIHYRLPSHINVVGCFGQTVINGVSGMVLEYASNGTLKSLLQALYRQDVIKNIKADDSFSSNLNIKCMKFSREVAAGMVHIAKHKIVNRDLAARNILMGPNDVCKISDFGLARSVNASSEYNMSSCDPIPIRWLSPESLFYKVYSQKSDVWSFGILLWEIIALGGTPYHNFKNGYEVRDALKSGYRMSAPKHCNTEIFEVMNLCWMEDAEERPTFDILEETLSRYLSDKKNYLNFKEFDFKLYEAMDLKIYREDIKVTTSI